MKVIRTAERVKRLSIEAVDDHMVRFKASLDDTCLNPDGKEVIHSLAIEGTISLPELEILSITPTANKQPYRECGASLDPVRQLVGLRIGTGFRAQVMELLGKTKGCTHFLTLALDIAAAHTLTIFLRMRDEVAFEGRDAPDGTWIRMGLKIEPRLENACIALTSDSRVIVNAKRFAK